ncbi:gamma carbonic anhydrase family protein [Pontibacillus salipaludis]|uniref:Gamma carbonic anhydrase family protein n=1 Tax=Pontibacillus salipaludis TaxID=1697394 RepID=A0ABQ1Q5F7_9BACI|nr:gamma carbonic anhydrase family protein [Pontibacillus salipaludis]GGD14955.1 gamma carbonic anhydrase family protein [Pontibacillus salipaludis]
MLYKYLNDFPKVDRSVFVAPGAHIIGDVEIEEESSIWFNAVLRGDEAPIRIGKRTSIQDNSTCHLYEGSPLTVGDEVTVGHNVVLHGCTIGNRSIVGMGSTILDGAEIGEECIIGANSLVPPGKTYPPRSLIIGSPAKVIRELNEEDLKLIQLSIDSYVEKGKQYKYQM